MPTPAVQSSRRILSRVTVELIIRLPQKNPLTVAGSVGFVCQAASYSAMSRAAFSFGASAFSAAGAAGAAT